MHAYGFAVAALVAWTALKAAVGEVRVTFGVAFAIVLMGMGLGALNEVVEFIATILLPETNVGGYINTGWDLVANLVGATSAAVFVWVSQRTRAPTLEKR